MHVFAGHRVISYPPNGLGSGQGMVGCWVYMGLPHQIIYIYNYIIYIYIVLFLYITDSELCAFYCTKKQLLLHLVRLG